MPDCRWHAQRCRDTYAGAIGKSDTEFGNTFMVEDPGYAHAYYPPLGSIWFTSTYDDLQHPALGDHGFSTYIHEIGHALGLNHMGDYNGDDDDGPSSYQDSSVLSLMSYYGPEYGRGKGDVMWGDWVTPDGTTRATQTPMLNDIMVIQAMYGGAGQDWAYFTGVFANYSLDYDLSGRVYTVHDSTGANGTDTLLNIEHAGFENFGGNLNDLTPAIHRFFNTNNGTHFFTASNDEASDINTIEGLIYEGIGFERNVMPDAQSITVHGFHNDITDTHFYTANNDEAAYIIETGDLTYEGVAFQAYAAKTESTTEVYRFYDTSTNSHFYTTNATEMENVKVELAGIYTFEGVAFYTEAA